MDRQQADSYLHQWAAWATQDSHRSPYSVSSWQKHVESGYAEESPRIRPGRDCDMELVDRAVTRVANQSPAMGRVLKEKYFMHRPVSFNDLNSALLRFISAWYEINPEAA